jgi:peptidoglycan/xylan/chitin deacetylase (PgdA/CDA1 family)
MSRRAWLAASAVLAALVLVAVTVAIVVRSARPAAPAAPTTDRTVVSLTFDDGQASQYATLSMLSSRGMAGAYYINSAMVGSGAYYMSWPQIAELAAAGNEVGGHTLHHVNLTTVDGPRATTEICDDRQNLINRGFAPVRSFAYPEAAFTPAAEQVVRGCGYTSARAAGNVSCGGCPPAETIPPPDPYDLRTPEGVTTSTTLATLQSYVTNAESHGGGWVILTFHGICDNRCTGDNSISPSIFTAFLDWLAPRSASGTVVRNVWQAMSTPNHG